MKTRIDFETKIEGMGYIFIDSLPVLVLAVQTLLPMADIRYPSLNILEIV
jgi:hypothetical protein